MAVFDVEMVEESDQGVYDANKACGCLLLMMIRILEM